MSEKQTTTKAPDGVRIDIWLWATRFFKTRALAKKALEHGHVTLNGTALAKASKLVRVGDRLLIERGEERFDVGVLGLPEQRTTAAVARTNYEETAASIAARAQAAERRRLESAGYSRPATKPDKRARRLLRALGDIDMT